MTTHVNRIPAIIPNNTALSGVVPVSPMQPSAIEMPAAWTAADLSFQVSHDGATWRDVFQDDGTEKTCSAAASRYILLNFPDISSVAHLRVRSGTAATPVNQGAARSLMVVLQSVPAGGVR